MNNILKYEYLNNISDIISISKNDNFKSLLNKIDNSKKILVTSHLIHKDDYISHYEQFIFNLDNYINFLKNYLHINQQEIKIITDLTIYNKYNEILYSNIYYYDDINKYEKEFIKLFMCNYNKNIKYLNKYIKIKKRNFFELVNHLNKIKKRTYIYFENINSTNMNFYLNIINYLENIN